MLAGFGPSVDIVANPEMHRLSLGIIEAAVTPHLHPGIVQTRAFGVDPDAKRQALRLATRDGTIAPMFALTVNASILILAAAALSLVTAAAASLWWGAEATGRLLTLSQVAMSVQRPTAIVPLAMVTASRTEMGDPVAPRRLASLPWWRSEQPPRIRPLTEGTD